MYNSMLIYSAGVLYTAITKAPPQSVTAILGKRNYENLCLLELMYVIKDSTQARACTTGQMHFVFCRLYSSSPQPPQQCLAPTCHLSTLN
jgi:hypothetical protein